MAYGKVFVGSYDNSVYCLNETDGSFIWKYTTDDSIVQSSPAVADGKVYIGSADYNVYCLDAYDGHKIWNYTTSRRSDSPPTVVDGKVYVGAGATSCSEAAVLGVPAIYTNPLRLGYLEELESRYGLVFCEKDQSRIHAKARQLLDKSKKQFESKRKALLDQTCDVAQLVVHGIEDMLELRQDR